MKKIIIIIKYVNNIINENEIIINDDEDEMK